MRKREREEVLCGLILSFVYISVRYTRSSFTDISFTTLHNTKPPLTNVGLGSLAVAAAVAVLRQGNSVPY